jgi:hypothetical protein
MSIKRSLEITCQQCRTRQMATVWETVNVTMNPEMKEAVTDLAVNVHPCVRCGDEITIDISFLYNDMQKRFCVRYLSRTEMSDQNTFAQFRKDGSLSLDGPARAMAEASGGGYMFQPHCVFSMQELAMYVIFRELCQEYGR